MKFVIFVILRIELSKQILYYNIIEFEITGRFDKKSNLEDFKMASRLMRETMCVRNIGLTTNSGDLIPADKPVRQVKGVLSTNVSVTALSDEEIEEFSKVNEDALVAGRSEYDHHYRIKFVGHFSLDNRCYAIMKPCMCVIGHEGDAEYIMTAKFSVMNSIAKLITRLATDDIQYAIVYRIDEGCEPVVMERFESVEKLVTYIRNNKKGINTDEKWKKIHGIDAKGFDDAEEVRPNDECEELLRKNEQLHCELEAKDMIIKKMQEELEQANKDKEKLEEQIGKFKSKISLIGKILAEKE